MPIDLDIYIRLQLSFLALHSIKKAVWQSTCSTSIGIRLDMYGITICRVYQNSLTLYKKSRMPIDLLPSRVAWK